MWYYPLSGLINGITLTILGIFVFLRNRHVLVNRTYVLFCFFISFWSYSYFLWQISDTDTTALFWCRMLMFGAVFVPAAYFHFIIALINKSADRSKKIMIFVAYSLAILFAVLNFTHLMTIDVRPRLKFPFWPTAGPAYIYFLVYFAIYASYGCYLLLKEIQSSSGSKRNQLVYILVGSMIGYIGGATNFPLWYDIKMYPVGNILSSVYVGLIGYAILRYRLMDITVLAARTLIFIIVYGVLLAIPLFTFFSSRILLVSILSGNKWWLFPFSVGVYALLASSTPFIYIYLSRRTEDIILKDQRRYQDTLRKISGTLTLIKDLERLLKFIVLRVARAVRGDFACIYIASDSKLVQKYPYTIKGFFPDLPAELSHNSELVSFLMTKSRPVFSEELSEKIRREFNLKTGLIIPSFVRGRLLGFLILGPKSLGFIYTEEDTNIFGILANQLALAIENSAFIEESQKTQAQLFAAEQMASMGTMAGGMTHQINNRFQAICMATSDSIDTLNLLNLEQSSKEELKTTFKEMRYNLERIQENTKHGGKIVNDFLNFSQPDRLQKEAKEFNLREPLERAIEMARIKTAFAEDLITKEIPNNLPKIQGNFVLIQDAYFNLLDNALDALTQRKNAIENKKTPEPESGYKGKILIKMFKQNTNLITQIKDNGIGMNEEAKKKIFVPFFTTKATAVKGTGLGLFVIQKIIGAHQGTISVESEYGKGTSFTITLPITKKKEGKDNA